MNMIPDGLVDNTPDSEYNKLVQYILDNGVMKETRNGKTLSVFGYVMRFNLQDSFPLITTKRVFWRGVVEELLWFISGSTNTKVLSDKGVKIWDANTSRETLDKLGFHDVEEGELRHGYGYQWRNFAGSVDQLQNCIDLLKKDPHSRRNIICSWNAKDIPDMVLPPCHVMCQFNVTDNKLSTLLFQRSGDVGLGIPFNIASYALLTNILAHICDLELGELVHVIGDAHIYESHIDALKEQITRIPFEPPQLKITCDKKNINEYTYDDFELVNYKCHSSVKMNMIV